MPSHSPQPDMPAIAAMPILQTASGGSNHLQNLPPLKGRQGPISDPIFLNKGSKNSGTSQLSQQSEHTNLHGGNAMGDFNQDPVHMQAVAHHMHPQYSDSKSGANKGSGNGD